MATEIAPAIDAIWQRSRGEIDRRIATLEDAVATMSTGALADELRAHAERDAHKLAGSLAMFGFPTGSRRAREIEQALRSGASAAADRLLIAEAVAVVREEFDRRSLPASLAEAVTAAGGRSSGSARQILATDDSALSPPEALQTLWQQSRAEILAQAEAIADAVTDALTGSLSEAARVQATRHAHQLAGSVGTLGFAVASDHARTLEHALRAPAGPPSADLPRLAELAVALRRELEDDRHCEPADAVTASSQEPPELMVVAGADQEIDRVEVARRGGRGFLARSLEPSDTIAAALDLRERVRIHGTRVLVVDDDAIVLSLLESVLTEADIGVTTCQDPGHFWQRLGEVCPDPVLLDFEMPGISGPDLCRTLRNETRWAALPVVFLTARTDAESVRAVFDAGADDYLSKPFVGPEVIARIANRLERVRAACSRKPTASPACPTAAARRRRSRRSCAWPSASSSRPRSR